ncbi:MAG: hypothetical protein V3V33_05435 [Candidatus Lokiarchaeia archaeon]
MRKIWLILGITIIIMILGLVTLFLPSFIITLEGKNFEGGTRNSFLIIKRVFLNGSSEVVYELRQWDVLFEELWNLSIERQALSIIFLIHLILIICYGFWHIFKYKKWRISLWLIIFISYCLNLFTLWFIFDLNIRFKTPELKAKFSDYLNYEINYALDFQNGFYIAIIIALLMIIDLLFNNLDIREVLGKKEQAKYENLIDQKILYNYDKYQKEMREINGTYKNGYFISMYILLRKLLENLLIDCLRSFYEFKEKNKFFNSDTGKFLNFEKLKDNFSEMINNQAFIQNVGQVPQSIIDLLKEFKIKGNANAHSIFSLNHKELVEEHKNKIYLILESLNNTLKRIEESITK